MPTEGMDKEMVDALSGAQQGKEVLAEMVIDLETQLDQTKSDKAAAYLDNSTLANELRRFEAKLSETQAERDMLLETNAKQKAAFAQSLDELKSQLDSQEAEKSAAVRGLERAEHAHQLERSALDSQLNKAHKFNNDLNEQLAGKEIELARTSSQATEAKHVSRSERQMREMFEGHLQEGKNHQDHLRTRMRELEAEAAEATKQYHKATDMIYSLQDQNTEIKQQKADALKAAREDAATLASEHAANTAELARTTADNAALNSANEALRSDLSRTKAELTLLKEAKALADAEVARSKAKLADANQDEALLCDEIKQLKATVQLLAREKDDMLKQKTGDRSKYLQEELNTLRSSYTLTQANTEAAVTQVRTEKSAMMCEIAELSEKLAASKAEITALTAQLDKSEATAVKVLADNEMLESQRNYYANQSMNN